MGVGGTRGKRHFTGEEEEDADAGGARMIKDKGFIEELSLYVTSRQMALSGEQTVTTKDRMGSDTGSSNLFSLRVAIL